ncbi:hypothetical protein OROMI_002123 [Orobanche minor]
MQTIRRAIVIGNGFAGAENQCIGLVRALGLSDNYSLYRVRRPRGGINEKLHWLPLSVHRQLDCAVQWISRNRVVPLLAQAKDVLEAEATHIAKVAENISDRDGPILVVASGRDTIAIASLIKRFVPENVFLVQIQHPRSRLDRFDLVITPQHDYYPLMPEAQKQIPFFLRRWVTPRKPPDKRVVLTVGALHQADSATLRDAASTWHDEMEVLPKPLLVVSIGGPTRYLQHIAVGLDLYVSVGNCRYGADLAMQLTDSLKSVLPTCGSLRISFSRRTPKIVADILMNELSNHPKVYIWNGEMCGPNPSAVALLLLYWFTFYRPSLTSHLHLEPNPHMGHLAFADAFVITADSISMLSEACSTGKPVYVIGAERCTWKFAYFLKSLQSRGAVRPFTGKENIADTWYYSPLCDLEKAADEVINALAGRGWRLMSE